MIMANTEHIEAKLCAYVDGELDALGRAEIEQHLVNNPQHRQLIADLSQQRDALRDLPRDRAPDDLYETFSSHLERSVLLESEPEAEAAVAGRINPWPQVYAAAAVVLLVVGLAAVIFFVLPKGPAHKLSDFAIAPTTTGPIAMSTHSPELGVADRTDVVRAGTQGSANPVVAEGSNSPAEALLKNDAFARGPASDRGFAPVARWGDQSGMFESNLNRRVQQVTNGAVNNPMVVLLNTTDPKAAEHQVTRFLGDNGISWQPINESAPESLNLDSTNVLMDRVQNLQVQLRGGPTPAPGASRERASTIPAFANSLEIRSKDSSPEADAIRQLQSNTKLNQLILARNLTARQVQALNACVAPMQPVLLNSQVDGLASNNAASSAAPNGARAAATQAFKMYRALTPALSPAQDYRFATPARAAGTQPSTAPAALRAGDVVGLSMGTSTELVIQTIDDKGAINVPNLGAVKVEGQTPEQGIDAIVKASREKGVAPGKVSLLPIRSPASTKPAASTQPAYTFKPGDQISVEYDYANPDLHRTPEVTVDDKGAVRLPLLGEFQTWGQTPDQLARSIADAATRFDAGPAMFFVKSKDAAGQPIVASAATTQPAEVAPPATAPAIVTAAGKNAATQPATPIAAIASPAAPPASQPLGLTTQPTHLLSDVNGPLQAVEAMVDVVIVVQPDAELVAPTTGPVPADVAPATQSFDLSLTPATAPTTAPAK
jgi:protein involved in polysaccharide export with SLBB domain